MRFVCLGLLAALTLLTGCHRTKPAGITPEQRLACAKVIEVANVLIDGLESEHRFYLQVADDSNRFAKQRKEFNFGAVPDRKEEDERLKLVQENLSDAAKARSQVNEMRRSLLAIEAALIADSPEAFDIALQRILKKMRRDDLKP